MIAAACSMVALLVIVFGPVAAVIRHDTRKPKVQR